MANILVVEDDKDLNNAYCKILQIAKHKVVPAFNGEEALTALTEFKPDVILLDLFMPIKSGVEFLKIYDATAHPETKLVIFTNLDNSPEVQEAFSLGADRYILKAGTSPAELMGVVKEALEEEKKSSKAAKV
jgi:two-component system response regulator VanR